jgi:hypothetical protein
MLIINLEPSPLDDQHFNFSANGLGPNSERDSPQASESQDDFFRCRLRFEYTFNYRASGVDGIFQCYATDHNDAIKQFGIHLGEK